MRSAIARMFVVGVIAGLSWSQGDAFAQSVAKDDAGKVVRAGGTFVVSRIDRNPDDSFVIEFRSEHASGRFDTLILHADHVHVGLKLGTTVRLSAEVAAEHGPLAEIAQVVLFFPSRQGTTPVWLLSRNMPAREPRAAPYIKMHAPQADYQIF